MAVICIDETETGNSYQFSGGEPLATTPNTAGAWSTYSITTGSGGNTYIWESAVSEFYGQFRMRISGNPYITFWDPGGNFQCQIRRNSGGYIYFTNGTTNWTATTYPLSNDNSTWYYVQFHIVVADGVGGSVEIRIDGNTVLNESGIDTRGSASSANVDRIELGATDSFNVLYDDWIIASTTGSGITSWPDGLGVEALMPNGAGFNTGLSRGGADSGSNYGQVDERPANSDTDYVYDTVVDDYDLYEIPSTTWDQVDVVALALRAKNDGPGLGSIAHMVRADTDGNGSADTSYTGSDIGLGTSYRNVTKIYDQQPDSTNWTAAKVNALQVGVKVR